MVPLERNDAIGEEMMATAMRLAVENNSPVVGVSADHDPGAGADRLPAAGARTGGRARCSALREELALEYHVPYTPVVGRTRSPGRMIVDAAEEHEAALIVIGAPDKRRLARAVRRQCSARRSTSCSGALPAG